MKCPYCDAEMKKGKSSFMSLNKPSHMMLSYICDEELTKGFF